ncbi:hypothetical protein ACQ4PT_005195 [Festuca glaucescens]
MPLRHTYVIPDTEGEHHHQAGLHVTAAAHLEAQVVLLPDDRQGEEKGYSPACISSLSSPTQKERTIGKPSSMAQWQHIWRHKPSFSRMTAGARKRGSPFSGTVEAAAGVLDLVVVVLLPLAAASPGSLCSCVLAASRKIGTEIRGREGESEAEMKEKTQKLWEVDWKIFRVSDIFTRINTMTHIVKMPYKLLQEITNNFSEEQRLGSGAFGEVYKGVLEGKEIAVKKLRSMQGINEKLFETEFGHLKRLKHQNIVQLVGFCREEEEVVVNHEGKEVCALYIHRALCLEYMPNGSLGNCLSGQYLGHNWQVHFRIIKGICEGLKYLHDVSIMHFDLKPDNILLDGDMVPKIADFGLSRLVGQQNTIMTMSPLGTLGFLPPEFINKQVISKEYDIFSLGAIIKRIVTGAMDKESIPDMDQPEYVELVHNYWKQKLHEIPTQSFEAACKQVKTCVEIAVKCTETDRLKRPKMEEIVHILKKVETKDSDSWRQIDQVPPL